MIEALRRRTQVPIIVFSYYNPILAYGAAAFHRDALDAGADGVLLVDVPPEESDELTRRVAGRPPVPDPPDDARPHRRSACSGSPPPPPASSTTSPSWGSPAARGCRWRRSAARCAQLRSVTRLPICVGFGISTPQEVAAVAGLCDGVVIGSAFERLIEANIGKPNLPDILAAQVAALKRATRPPSS